MPGIETGDPLANTIILAHLVGDIEIPCDFAESWDDCPNGPAKWVALRVTCECGFNGGARLICTHCKDVLMMSEDAIQCAGPDCPIIYQPARTIVSMIEAL